MSMLSACTVVMYFGPEVLDYEGLVPALLGGLRNALVNHCFEATLIAAALFALASRTERMTVPGHWAIVLLSALLGLVWLLGASFGFGSTTDNISLNCV